MSELGSDGELVAEISRILLAHDPMRIDYGCEDEYDPEAKSIAGRLPACSDLTAAQQMIHEEFVRWFAEDLAGPLEHYGRVSQDVWHAWVARRGTKR